MSSAKLTTLVITDIGKFKIPSLMMFHKRGASTDPCGTLAEIYSRYKVGRIIMLQLAVS